MPKRKRAEERKDEKAEAPPAKLPKETEDMISQLIDLTGLPEELWAMVIRDYTAREPIYSIPRLVCDHGGDHYTSSCIYHQFADYRNAWGREWTHNQRLLYGTWCALQKTTGATCNSPLKTLVGGYWWSDVMQIQSVIHVLGTTVEETRNALRELVREGFVSELVRYAF